MNDAPRPPRPVGDTSPTADDLLPRVALGDKDAFGALYELLASQVFGVVCRVLRNPSHAEEVSQEVFVEIWRTASRFDPSRGSVRTWATTLAHRRAVDRVRSEQAATDRERRAAAGDNSRAYDQVVEEVTASLEQEQVRRCLGSLTDLQRQAVTLAYYVGYNYREVAEVLGANLATVKTRMRDGLARLRDCIGNLELGAPR
ncbi:ECF RNA polymerase sigma factor SigK [Actinopolymorpha sp. NPDC004070]|uniref:ECF RNA polymerase sigma factor SigK n=1 Tax=Actinopolymorpha sp. NPDC004070 TaxID=3154548 RepID=UPI0033AC4DC0